MSVYVFKLNSGEEIIAEATEQLETGSWKISKALRIIIRPAPNPQDGFVPALTPWIAAYDGRRIEIKAQSLLITPFVAPSHFEQVYLEETSGIAVVTNNSGIVS